MNARTAQQLTYGLAGVCGVLALVGILAWMGAGRGYRWLDDSGEAAPVTGVGRIDAGQSSIPPEAQFAEIQQRPIFNEDRKPTPPAPPDKTGEEVKAVPLNITLTGIVLSPAARLAMVQDNAKNEAVTLRIGMPLPGDQQVWTLSEIKNRSVVFKNQADETAEVELQVAAVAAIAPPQSRLPTPPPPMQPTAASPVPPPPPPGANANAPAQPADRAAELQRRIEERRREMREQAEKLRQQQDQNKNSE